MNPEQPAAPGSPETPQAAEPAAPLVQQPTEPMQTNAKPTVTVSEVTPVEPSQPAADPAKTLGIVGLILAIFLPLIGLIVSIIARSKSKKAGFKNGLALAGIIVSIVMLLLTIVTIGGILMVTATAVKAPQNAANAFMSNLASNNLSAAYTETSAAFQKDYTEELFSEAFKPAVEAGLKTESIQDTSFQTNNGVTTAIVVYNGSASDGSYKVTVSLTKEDGVWKVDNVSSKKQ